MAARPNVLLLFSDQHRADAMGCAGDAVIQTPNLDRLAAEGVRFAQANCTSPLCMPSRASITTGLYAHNHGVLDNATGNLLPVLPTFVRALQQAGYHTSGIGKFHYMQHQTISDMDELHDLTPTILELAGVEPLRTCEGRSLLSPLEQPSDVPAG